MALGDTSLLFRIKGDATDAVRALNQTQREANDLTGATSKLSGGLASLAGPAALVGAGIAAVGAAAVAGGVALFNLSKSAAEYGSAIFDATQKTGLGAETMSALKVAAEQSGSSFEGVTNAVAKFNVLIGNAATGNEKAQKILEQYGITARETQPALEQAITKIAQMGSSSQQAAAAGALFKDRTGEILPVIKSFDGDLPGLISKLRELGVLMSDEDAKAADEFGDQMDTLNAQISAVTRNIGISFMPIFLDMAKAMSDFVKNNQSDIRTWGNNVSLTISGLIQLFKELKQAADDYYLSDAIKFLSTFDPLTRDATGFIERLQARGRANAPVLNAQGGTDFELDPVTNTIRPRTPAKPDTAPTEDAGARDARLRDAEEKAREAERERAAAKRLAERIAERDLLAQIRIESLNLKTVEDAMAAAYQKMRDTLGGSDSIKQFTAETNAATQQWALNLNQSLTYLEELEKRQLGADATANERALLDQQQLERRHKLKLEQDAEIKKNADAAWELLLQRGDQAAEREQREFEERMERLERLQEAMGLGGIPALSEGPLPGLTDPRADEEEGIFDQWADSWLNFFNLIESTAPTLSETLGGVANILQNAFQGFANAISNVVQQWVLYGNTGPAVMRKILAAALASIAAEAAVRAIWELALGFATLFFNPAESVAHFTAAALFGSISVGAALAGRAVAGNAFKQQTTASAGASTGAGGGNRSTSAQGEYYTGTEGTQVVEEGINQPAIRSEVVLKIDDRSGWFADMFQTEIGHNSKLRQLIIDTANA
jgi:hypothetical protein